MITDLAYGTEEYTFVRKWGTEGSADGQFQSPHALAIGPSDSSVYVTQISGDRRVQKFTSIGNFIIKWGSQCDIVPGTGCIDPDGPDGPLSKGDGQFMYPRGIAVDESKGEVYVSDAQNRRVQKFTNDGQFITKWGSPGTSDGQFNGPHGVAVDPATGDVYVVENDGNRVQKFTSDGKFITKWGSEGTSEGDFHFPQGIAVGSNGDVFVVDTFNHRIEKFTKDGKFITQWGSQGSRDGQLDFPADITIDSSDNVYVGDKNRRVQKFTSDGEFITKWGSFCNLSTGSGCVDPDGEDSLSSGDGQFSFPQGIVVDHSGNVYVVDIFNNRIEVFALITDTTVPDTTITSMIDGNGKLVTKGGFSSSNSITFKFEGTDNEGVLGFRCKLDQNNFENCSSPKTFVTLQDGKHTFSVLAIDTSSNEDPSPAIFDWSIDTIEPIVTVPTSDLVAQATSSSGAVVTFSATAQDNIDGDLAANCIPASGSIFSVGSTDVNCSATDKSGNTGTASFNVLVKVPPKPTTEPTSLSLVIKPNRPVGIGQDYSLYGRLLDGTAARKLVGGQEISFTSEPSGVISVPNVKTDASGNFILTGLKAPDKDGSYKIVAHFPGGPFLQPSDSIPVLLKVEKKTTLLKLQIKGSPISGASLKGELTDSVTHKGISSQIISFTTNKPELVVHATITDSNGRYNVLLGPFQCGTENIQVQSHFLGTDVFKPSDSRVSVLKVPRCSTSHQMPSSSLEVQTLTNS